MAEFLVYEKPPGRLAAAMPVPCRLFVRPMSLQWAEVIDKAEPSLKLCAGADQPGALGCTDNWAKGLVGFYAKCRTCSADSKYLADVKHDEVLRQTLLLAAMVTRHLQ